jgi:hypothetical protein
MPKPPYSKTDFERDLQDGVVVFDAQAKQELRTAPAATMKSGKVGRPPSSLSVYNVRLKHRPIFDQAYDRHLINIA